MQAPFANPTAVSPSPTAAHSGRVVRPRHMQFAGFVAAVAWYFCAKALAASAANGIGTRFDLGDLQPMVEAVFLLFLVILGIGLLAGIERRRAPLRLTIGLPRRRSAAKEWAEGAAIGWGLAVACVLPMLLARTLHAQLWTAPRAWELVVLNVLTLAVLTLAQTIGIYGYAFHRLIEATGPTRATVLLAVLAAIDTGFNPGGGSPGIRIVVTIVATVLLCLCWTRTHGLWLLWGVYLAWSTVTSVVFGLPLAGSSVYPSVVETRAFGPEWLTGGDFGPQAAFLSAVFGLVAIAVLMRMTSDYAWDYTRAPLIPAGIEVDVPPPAAHSAMESTAAAPPAPPRLVQIVPTTPRSPVIVPPAE
ncbi:MAG: hypothetical protein NVSMB62_01450 [Acidobacteriaceae bacterium]